MLHASGLLTHGWVMCRCLQKTGSVWIGWRDAHAPLCGFPLRWSLICLFCPLQIVHHVSSKACDEGDAGKASEDSPAHRFRFVLRGCDCVQGERTQSHVTTTAWGRCCDLKWHLMDTTVACLCCVDRIITHCVVRLLSTRVESNSTFEPYKLRGHCQVCVSDIL